MTSLERVKNAITGNPVDRIPCFPISIANACEIIGVKQRDYNLDPECMADTLIQFREKTGFDGIYVSRDNWVYHEALGGILTSPDDGESYSKNTVLQSMEDFHTLSVPDPWNTQGMEVILRAAKRVVDRVGNEYYIQANIDTGPFTLGGVLLGLERFLVDITSNDEGIINGYLSFCTDVVIAYGQAMLETGVHGIQFGDASASLVGPHYFEKYVLPWEGKVGDCFQGKDCDLWIHICGKTDQFLYYLRTVHFQGFEVDTHVPLPLARNLLGDEFALKGNLDTTFLLQETPEAIYNKTREIIKSGSFKTGIIMSPGCAVPRMTPLENLIAMKKACEDTMFL